MAWTLLVLFQAVYNASPLKHNKDWPQVGLVQDGSSTYTPTTFSRWYDHEWLKADYKPDSPTHPLKHMPRVGSDVPTQIIILTPSQPVSLLTPMCWAEPQVLISFVWHSWGLNHQPPTRHANTQPLHLVYLWGGGGGGGLGPDINKKQKKKTEIFTAKKNCW